MGIYVRRYRYVEIHRRGVKILTYVYEGITYTEVSMNEANQNKLFITLSLINIIKYCLYVLQPTTDQRTHLNALCEIRFVWPFRMIVATAGY